MVPRDLPTHTALQGVAQETAGGREMRLIECWGGKARDVLPLLEEFCNSHKTLGEIRIEIHGDESLLDYRCSRCGEQILHATREEIPGGDWVECPECIERSTPSEVISPIFRNIEAIKNAIHESLYGRKHDHSD